MSDNNAGDDADFPELMGCLMIFGGLIAYDSKRQQKLSHRDVYVFETRILEYLRWFEEATTLDWADRSNHIP